MHVANPCRTVQVYVPSAKHRTLQLLTVLPAQLLSVVSTDPCSQLHVGWTSLAPDELQAYLAKQQEQGSRAWTRIMGFRATGKALAASCLWPEHDGSPVKQRGRCFNMLKV